MTTSGHARHRRRARRRRRSTSRSPPASCVTVRPAGDPRGRARRRRRRRPARPTTARPRQRPADAPADGTALSRATTMANRSLPAGRYFGAFVADRRRPVRRWSSSPATRPHAAARPRPAGRHHGHPDRPHARRQGARPGRPRAGPPDHRAAGQRPRRRRGRGRHRGQREHRHLGPRRQRRPGPRARRRPRSCGSARSRSGPEPAAARRRTPRRAAGATPDRPRRRRPAAAPTPPTATPRRGRASRRAATPPAPTAAATPPDGAVDRPRRPATPTRPPVHARSRRSRRRYATLHLRQRRTSPARRAAGPRTTSPPAARTARVKYLLGPAIIEGTEIADASAGTDARPPASGSSRWTSTTQGRDDLGRATPPRNVGNAASRIVLDGQVVSAPTINGRDQRRHDQITGNFTQAEATELANQLKYGALPLTLHARRPRSRSRPTLGAEQLQAGLIAGGIGLALVFVYALLYYRAARPGHDRQPGAVRRSSSTRAWCCSAGRSASP